MPSTSTFQQRTAGSVAKSTVATSATAAVGSRAQNHGARNRSLTLVGGAVAASTVVLSASSKTLSSTTGTFQLTATIKNSAGDFTGDPVDTWASDAPSKATVSNTGLVTGVATGSANITATVGGVTSSACAITVP